jgi:hypothetical protein
VIHVKFRAQIVAAEKPSRVKERTDSTGAASIMLDYKWMKTR